MSNIAVSVRGVYKDFKLPHQKKDTIKSIFTSLFEKSAKSYEVQHALKDISFDIKEGEFFGIVGRNGSGKSTLLKILAGIYQPTKGNVAVKGKLVPFIELGVGFNPELTGRQNVYLNGSLLGFSKKEIDLMYDDIVDFAEIERFMDQKLKNYSSGMQVRLAFSMAIRAEADVLLVDEVLAVGDADFQRKCFKYFKELKAKKKTVVFVTHDMSSVREYCDRAMLINDSEVSYIGTAQEAAKEYSLLFLDDNNPKEKIPGTRWGSGAAKFSHISAKSSLENINVSFRIDFSKSVDKALYGLHIFTMDGIEITATNNRMLGKEDLENLSNGDSVKFDWQVMNIFNDGKYNITLTLVSSDGVVLDWYNEATSFVVKRSERSTTSVIPPIKVNKTIIKAGASHGK